ncbi:MAG: hypothetical protein MJZ48_01295 [Paludibacteraceae bacterium]|nr:hypothetical protein [Paludibacteraceae bacterium]
MKDNKDIKLQDFISGEILVRKWCREQYLLFILIGILVFLYIFFGFQAQRQQHHLTVLQKEWQSKHFEQLTIEAELTERTRQSTMSRQLAEYGSPLKENKQPVIHIP